MDISLLTFWNLFKFYSSLEHSQLKIIWNFKIIFYYFINTSCTVCISTSFFVYFGTLLCLNNLKNLLSHPEFHASSAYDRKLFLYVTFLVGDSSLCIFEVLLSLYCCLCKFILFSEFIWKIYFIPWISIVQQIMETVQKWIQCGTYAILIIQIYINNSTFFQGVYRI